MKNINYKYTTWVLVALLVLPFIWRILPFHYFGYGSYMMGSGRGMHNMRSGNMMRVDDSEVTNDMTMSDMVNMMDGKTGKALEKEFIVGMIPHHQGAVDMAKKLLADPTVSLELKNFANQIISAQEGEIKMMGEWLKKY